MFETREKMKKKIYVPTYLLKMRIVYIIYIILLYVCA